METEKRVILKVQDKITPSKESRDSFTESQEGWEENVVRLRGFFLRKRKRFPFLTVRYT